MMECRTDGLAATIDRFCAHFGRVSGAVGRIGGYTAVLATVCLLFYEVIARYVFNAPTTFALELGLVFQVVLVAAAAALVLRDGGHVAIELLTERMSARPRMRLDAVHSLFGALLCALLAWLIWRSAAWSLRVGSLTESIEVPLAPLQFFMFAGFVLLGVQFLCRAWTSFRQAGGGRTRSHVEEHGDVAL